MHGRRRIFSVGGWGGGGEGAMKRALTENICKRTQYDLPRPRSDNDGPGALCDPPRDLRHPRRLGIPFPAF